MLLYIATALVIVWNITHRAPAIPGVNAITVEEIVCFDEQINGNVLIRRNFETACSMVNFDSLATDGVSKRYKKPQHTTSHSRTQRFCCVAIHNSICQLYYPTQRGVK